MFKKILQQKKSCGILDLSVVKEEEEQSVASQDQSSLIDAGSFQNLSASKNKNICSMYS